MSYVMINDVAVFLFERIFGHGLIMSLFILTFFIVMLFLLRANVVTILIVIVPLILTFALAPVTTNIIDFPPWLYLGVFIGFGIVAAFAIIINQLK